MGDGARPSSMGELAVMSESNRYDVETAAARMTSSGVVGLPEAGRELSVAASLIVSEPPLPAFSQIVLAGIVRLVEFGLITAIGTGIYLGYVFPTYGFAWYYPATAIGIAALAVLAFQAADVYDVHAFRNPFGECGQISIAWFLIFLIVAAVAFFAHLNDFFSRLWLAGFFGGGLVAITAVRILLYGLIRYWTRAGRLERRTVIVGGGEAGELLIEALDTQRQSDVRIVGLFDDRGDDRAPMVCSGQQKLGTVDDLVAFARRTRIDLVIFALPISAESRILQMLKKLWVLPVDIRLSAHSNKLRFRPRSYSYIGNVPVIDVFDKPIADWDVVMKWLFDKVVGGVLLLAAAPAMALIALMIRLDSPGPIFFKQKRYGFNNELIAVYKFRSMFADQCDPTASKLVTKFDPRVTRVGRFLRKTSLDELPQLINVVFKGNLSLVGPRPHAVYAKAADRLYDEAVDGYFARHRVKPGITGWAQINGWRGETNNQDKIQRRVEHDLYYIENWSILLDLYILAMTPLALAKTTAAY
jgi:Undecaprenyl-phosphate glucose phosphotransferase